MSESVDAGDFGEWLATMGEALRGRGVSDVPCGSCNACCRSSQFITVSPDELDALAAIPRELLFPTPRLAAGHLLMGYDERGHCPMLIDDRCSIYEHRPRTCRVYDCRIFPASGVDQDEPNKADIGERAAQWTFRYATPGDRAAHDAVRAAAAFVAARSRDLPVTLTPNQRAAVAIRVHHLFVDGEPTVDELLAALAAR